MYDDAIAEGTGAYLLEQSTDKKDVFSVSVGNLPAGKQAAIKITYVTELEFLAGSLRFILPSGSPKRSNGASDSSVDIDFSITLTMSGPITSITSSSHQIKQQIENNNNSAVVTLQTTGKNDKRSKCKDFIMEIQLESPHEAFIQSETDSEGNAVAMVSLFPELNIADDEDICTEIIFLVDRSGSMSGSRIQHAKAALATCVQTLFEGSLFNIVGFGDDADFLFKQSVKFTTKTLRTAKRHIDGISADLGGTNILTPLKLILEKPATPGYSRQLFILTDGEVSNSSDCIDYIRKHSNTTRVFTFGIGAEADQALVKGLASAGKWPL
eukprot:TRINITY_DN1150_c0_g1_i1.p1 TRINITY_DN1150_c0_g1~~TRINITY_DN1150_c0_g1_i1.p1  ORF type:complete len:326 (+),score=61.99 TRINITY_DN1150_c0_g1_i1:117-1094(+)